MQPTLSFKIICLTLRLLRFEVPVLDFQRKCLVTGLKPHRVNVDMKKLCCILHGPGGERIMDVAA